MLLDYSTRLLALHGEAYGAVQGGQPAGDFRDPFAHATTWLMRRKGMLGANLNAWIDLQQEGKTQSAEEARAIA